MAIVSNCPAERGGVPAQRSHAASRRNRRRRRPRLLPLLLAALAFGGGFLLGRAQASPTGGEDAGGVSQLPSASSSTDTGSGGENAESWELLLVNGENPLPEDFSVPRLTELKNGESIDSRVYPALQKMMDAARAAGCEPLICSSYRTWEQQEGLFQKKVRACLEQGYTQTEAEEQASRWVARPGTSEHQAGLAVDIVDVHYQLLDEKQESTPAQQWLMAHCAEYGFILRYPTAKSAVTGVGYEPWHYRYVGLTAAKKITEQGLCLEEYKE